MAGFEDLGAALAGNSSGNALSYAKGLSLGANTEVALQTARDRAQKNTALDKLESTMSGFGITDPAQAAAFATSARAGIDPGQFPGARLKMQEADTRHRIATDPAVDDTAMQRLLSSLAPGPVQTYESAGEGMVTNRLHPELGVNTTPLGDALVGQRNAAAALDTEKRTNPAAFRAPAAAGGPRLSAGFIWGPPDEDGNPTQIPIKGGPKDPNAPAALGSREATFLQRSITGAKLGLENIRNIMELPAGASTGVMGIGASPGHSVLQATRDTLRNSMSSDEVQDYNTMLAGLSRNLATIETSGLVPSGEFTNSFNAMTFREGDTEQAKLHKLAEMRQIIEFGMDVALNNPRVPEEQKTYLRDIIGDVQRVVPFTHRDVTSLSKVPGSTLADLVKRRGLGTPEPAGAVAPGATAAPTGAAPQTFATEAEAEAAGIKPGTRVIIGGVPGTWQ